MGMHSSDLPDFPWDLLAPHKARAESHPDGILDFSIGSPVDPTPELIAQALREAADSPGYPKTGGTPTLRAAIREHYRSVRGVRPPDRHAILPTIGSKEIVATLPSLLGLTTGDVVIHPSIAYPTYALGARLAGATPVPADRADALPRGTAGRARLLWLNSPSNPTGRVASVEELRGAVTWARERGIVVASDECYAALPWTEPWATAGVPSVLDPRVNGGDLTGILALYSLSKRSNAAGYRMAWICGDPLLIGPIHEIRRHMGMMMPGPVQWAMGTALGDETHVDAQRERYRARRATLAGAVEQAGYVIDDSQAGLYLWVRAQDGRGDWAIVADLAAKGILVAPGSFYGESTHVRVALTASDAAVAAAALRLAAE
ncbi:MAG: succinyldiaminopimelate transaminase [Bifidobacteriaceae bacterium]|nr:succinyldiaminopimelate transaminase [Bifidobacteriaceae bacterium]